jgi:predicted DNA binding CopG/RHH family protein
MAKDELEQEREIVKKIAKNTIEKRTKKKSLNLRVFEDDIERIKAIALNQGLPYQTFLSSIIHKVATKQIEV